MKKIVQWQQNTNINCTNKQLKEFSIYTLNVFNMFYLIPNIPVKLNLFTYVHTNKANVLSQTFYFYLHINKSICVIIIIRLYMIIEASAVSACDRLSYYVLREYNTLLFAARIKI